EELRRAALPRLEAMLDRCVQQGLTGLAADIVSYTLVDWGFEPSTVTAKTLLLYGGADATVGAAHARWYKDRVRNSRIEVVPDFGHLLIIPMWDRVLSHLAPGSRSKQP
ncbi:MAG TPA: alpha/beta hydrolase, partial [Mycobacterium sp.]|nr:alpha/beta hydrolase [Mycobacterium sp.]